MVEHPIGQAGPQPPPQAVSTDGKWAVVETIEFSLPWG